MEFSDHNISVFIDAYYNNGEYKEYDLTLLLAATSITLNKRDIDIFTNKLVETGFLERIMLFTEDYIGYSGRLRLTENGILLLKKHGSYVSYVDSMKKHALEKAKKERRERFWKRFETFPKWFWPAPAIGAVVLIFISSNKTINCNRQDKRIENELKSDTTQVLKP